MIAFAHYLSRRYVLVLLAGALHPSPLRRQLDVPVLELPLARDRTMLDAWLETIAKTAAPIARLVIVVSSQKDAQSMRELVESRQALAKAAWEASGSKRQSPTPAPPCEISVMIDPEQWRGPAGLLRDIATASELSDESRIRTEASDTSTTDGTLFVCAEAAVLPPRNLDPLLVRRADPTIAGAIGAAHGRTGTRGWKDVTTELRPAGVYAFTERAICLIPPIGFLDIKEQLLPSLYRAGLRVPVVPLCPEAVRVRDLDSYLLSARHSLGHANAISRSKDAAISESAILSGSCIVQDDVEIEDGCVIHESIIMRGTKIGGGSIVARSIIGPDSRIEARSVIRSAVVAPAQRPFPRWIRRRRLGNRLFPLRSIVADESRS